MGVGPTSQAWEARILPMYYARKVLAQAHRDIEREQNFEHTLDAKIHKTFNEKFYMSKQKSILECLAV